MPRGRPHWGVDVMPLQKLTNCPGSQVGAFEVVHPTRDYSSDLDVVPKGSTVSRRQLPPCSKHPILAFGPS